MKLSHFTSILFLCAVSHCLMAAWRWCRAVYYNTMHAHHHAPALEWRNVWYLARSSQMFSYAAADAIRFFTSLQAPRVLQMK